MPSEPSNRAGAAAAVQWLLPPLLLLRQGIYLNQGKVTIAVSTPRRVFTRDHECISARAGLRCEHREVVTRTIGVSSEAGDGINLTTTFAHVAIVVSEILCWLKGHSFSSGVGRQTARWNPRPVPVLSVSNQPNSLISVGKLDN